MCVRACVSVCFPLLLMVATFAAFGICFLVSHLQVSCYMIELYRDKLIDLFAVGNSSEKLEV